MNDSYNYLIELLNAFLNKEKIVLSSEYNWDDIYIISVKHNVCGMIFSVINKADNKNTVPKAVFDRFENTFYDYVYRHNQQINTLNEAEDALKSAKMRYVPFKGADICNIYPVPEVRAMGDVDVLVDESNIASAGKILKDAGFECTASGGYVHDYKKDGILLELHSRVMIGKVKDVDICEFYKDAISYANFVEYKGKFDDNYNFALIITHIAHHLLFKGAGIRMILDLAVLLKYNNIDLGKVFDILKQCKLDKFGADILWVANKWFNLDINYHNELPELEDYICSFGAFGSNDKSPNQTVLRKELSENNNSNAFKTKLHLLFPSYEKMKSIPYISFIKGRPYLTPAAWVYRLIYNLANRKEFLKQSVTGLNDEKTKEAASLELNLLREIDLL